MRIRPIVLAILCFGCSVEEPSTPVPVASAPAASTEEKPSQTSDAPTPAIEESENSSDAVVEQGPETPAAEDSPSFTPDPESLSFKVVFHLGESDLWQAEESLKPVIAETQRILAQAKIEIIPVYTQDPASTGFLDVTYVPSVPDRPSVNGISFGGADLEVFVRDDVGLGRVTDNRPVEAPLGRTFVGAKPGDVIAVNRQQAEQARTTAHEIGHQLGLPHRQDSTNLMASGTTGWTLNAAEIKTMRETAVRKFKAKFLEVIE